MSPTLPIVFRCKRTIHGFDVVIQLLFPFLRCRSIRLSNSIKLVPKFIESGSKLFFERLNMVQSCSIRVGDVMFAEIFVVVQRSFNLFDAIGKRSAESFRIVEKLIRQKRHHHERAIEF